MHNVGLDGLGRWISIEQPKLSCVLLVGENRTQQVVSAIDTGAAPQSFISAC